MRVWVDAQLPPSLAAWLTSHHVEAQVVRDLSLRDAADVQIFEAAKGANAIVLTKDADFARLVLHRGPPPQIVWLTCGNTSNSRLREILDRTWAAARVLLEKGEALVEIGDLA